MRPGRLFGHHLVLVLLLAMSGLVPAARAQPTHDWVLRLSVPYINGFYLQPSGETDAKVNTGFWGFGVGLLHRHSASQYVGLAASVAADVSVPFPAAVDYLGEHEFMSAWAIDLTNNHRWQRFALGLIDRPNLYRLGSDAGFAYEHVVSVDIAWNVGLF